MAATPRPRATRATAISSVPMCQRTGRAVPFEPGVVEVTGGAQLLPPSTDQRRRRAGRGVGELTGRHDLLRPVTRASGGSAAGDVAPGVDDQRAQRAAGAGGRCAPRREPAVGRDQRQRPLRLDILDRRPRDVDRASDVDEPHAGGRHGDHRTPERRPAGEGDQRRPWRDQRGVGPTACQPEADAHPGADQPDRHRQRSAVPGANLLGHGAIVPATSVGATPDGRISR